MQYSLESKLLYQQALEISRGADRPFDSASLLLAIFAVRCEAQSILLEKHTGLSQVLYALERVEPEQGELVTTVYSTAAQIAQNIGSPQVTSVHLLMAISRLPETRAARVLAKAGLPLFALRTQAMAHLTDPRMRRAAIERMHLSLEGNSQMPIAVPVASRAAVPVTTAVSRPVLLSEAHDDEPVTFEAIEEDWPEEERPRVEVVSETSRFALDRERFPTLVNLGQNLNIKAERGEVDPLIGREDALERVIDILCKRRSNNPMLLGDPGVGKTALVEGLARLIVEQEKQVPALAGKVIVSVSVADLVAGTATRGSFASRLKALKEEVLAAERRVILFIDEIHTLIGAGVGDGGLDAANDLKGALARGEFPCIGATTFGEYKVHIFPDEALRRRFDCVYLREPSLEEAERILEGVAPRYAAHHQVSFTPEAYRAAVRLTDRLIPDRSLPAKAIEVLDRAGARVHRQGRSEVSQQDVVNALAAMVDLPREFLALTPVERFKGIEAAIRERVIGHDEAITKVMRTLAKNWVRFGCRRPLGSFVFVGPPGVGKHTLAVSLASHLFGSPQAFLEIDLADYAEVSSISHLIGSPPGYVGHEEGGLLADTLVRHPFLVVVWQHVDQAHPSVQALLTQILAEGTATNRRGQRMDFRNTCQVILVTDSSEFATARPLGFGARQEVQSGPRERIGRVLPSELLASVDEVVAFSPLNDEALFSLSASILKVASEEFRREVGIRLFVAPEVEQAVFRVALKRGKAPAIVNMVISDLVLRPARDIAYSLSEPPPEIRVWCDKDGPDGPTIRVGPDLTQAGAMS